MVNNLLKVTELVKGRVKTPTLTACKASASEPYALFSAHGLKLPFSQFQAAGGSEYPIFPEALIGRLTQLILPRS